MNRNNDNDIGDAITEGFSYLFLAIFYLVLVLPFALIVFILGILLLPFDLLILLLSFGAVKFQLFFSFMELALKSIMFYVDIIEEEKNKKINKRW